MCPFERASKRHRAAVGRRGRDARLRGEFSACIHAICAHNTRVRDVRAFEVGDPAAR